jgi:CRISPR-associated endoribonuclease Cas6
MRLKLILQINNNSLLPINYQYELSSWFYNVINKADSEFAMWLHKQGYNDDSKKFKLFTFSNIIPEKYKIKNNKLYLLSQNARLFFSFYAEEIPERFVTGIFKQQNFTIGDKISKTEFIIKSIEKIKEVEFSNEMKMRLITPVHITKKNPFNSKKTDHLNPEHKDFEHLFFSNLIEKYNIYNNYKTKFDINKCNLKILSEPKSKLITIKQRKKDQTKLKGFLFDFIITAPVELIRMGYYAGFGKSNSLGFGYCEIF